MNIGQSISPSLLNALQSRVHWWGKQQDDRASRRWEKQDDGPGFRHFGRFRPQAQAPAPETPDVRSEQPGPARGEVVSRQKLDYRAWTAEGSTSAGLTIRTDEGDVVTISRSTETALSYSSLRYKSRDENGSLEVSEKTREFSYSESISLTVEGDLNEQELADIQKFLDRVGPALEEFRSEGELAGRLVVDGSEFESLAGFEFSFRQTWEFTAIHARLRSTTRAGILPRPDDSGSMLGPPSDGWFGGGSVADLIQGLEGPDSLLGPPPSGTVGV